ncbi:MAG TPA: hypothetical protein DHV16_02960 [Nitrospiraceae bacterium]|nr:hypothetical protein [Nitrospiraceae bacterium]
MNMPVFEHTICSLHSLVNNEAEPLQKISHLIKYDPGLYFSLLQDINSSTKRGEITSISQAISLVGAAGIENHILKQDHFLGEEYLLLWSYAAMAGEAAARINDIVGIAEEEEAFFCGMMSCIGILLMARKHPAYTKILEVLLKLTLRDKIFIENRLFKTNQLEELNKTLVAPELYKNLTVQLVEIFGDERKGEFIYPSKLSSAYKSFQLMQLMNISEVAARVLLFPSVTEAQEKIRELAVRYFRIPETAMEELLAGILERFEDVCGEFNVERLSRDIIEKAGSYSSFSGITFLTKSDALTNALDSIFRANNEGKNIFIYGEPGVGKRLLAIALHHRPDNPRLLKPFISVFCSALDNETLEIELFGAKGGFRGLDEHKGILELAHEGTVLLKDIDKIPLIQQDRLEEVFCKDEFYKVGSMQPAFFDVRFIMTSQKNIFEEAKNGMFSEKLLRVLKPLSICIPPLRERREDIEFIAGGIIQKYGLDLTDKALLLGLREYYENHAFPENLHDLKRLLFYLSVKHRLES